MANEQGLIYGSPAENFEGGIIGVDIPELGVPKKEGKVRDIWVIDNPRGDSGKLRIMVTTDRQSAFNHIVGTTPGKGQL